MAVKKILGVYVIHSRCQTDIDECEGDGRDKCFDNGDCVDGIGEFKCVCDDDYTGTHCDKRKKSSCADSPCENGATCHDVGEQINGVFFECRCAPGSALFFNIFVRKEIKFNVE